MELHTTGDGRKELSLSPGEADRVLFGLAGGPALRRFKGNTEFLGAVQRLEQQLPIGHPGIDYEPGARIIVPYDELHVAATRLALEQTLSGADDFRGLPAQEGTTSHTHATADKRIAQTALSDLAGIVGGMDKLEEITDRVVSDQCAD